MGLRMFVCYNSCTQIFPSLFGVTFVTYKLINGEKNMSSWLSSRGMLSENFNGLTVNFPCIETICFLPSAASGYFLEDEHL